MAKKPLSDRQYITRSGLTCPLCHKERLTGVGEPVEGKDPLTYLKTVHCTNLKCQAEFVEVFVMTGITHLRDGQKNRIHRSGDPTPESQEPLESGRI